MLQICSHISVWTTSTSNDWWWIPAGRKRRQLAAPAPRTLPTITPYKALVHLTTQNFCHIKHLVFDKHNCGLPLQQFWPSPQCNLSELGNPINPRHCQGLTRPSNNLMWLHNFLSKNHFQHYLNSFIWTLNTWACNPARYMFLNSLILFQPFLLLFITAFSWITCTRIV